MTSETFILGLAGFLHNLFTVIWIGGLIMILITVLPVAKNTLEDNKLTQKLMHGILKRQRVWVYISFVGLFLTGLIQARMTQNFSGLMRFDTAYSSLVSIKHVLTLAMIGIAVFRSVVFGKKGETATPQQNKLSLKLVFLNAFLGVVILLLSGFLAAL
ncbi:MAG: hypothetical protein CVU41_17810 [Chloroflexi bacterium HGW-Chloroflexi-3]|nr:MAG: hypothetical protein CVU41_17810 [Chloroflexi bacterium HGW-Chloroflexi-3]